MFSFYIFVYIQNYDEKEFTEFKRNFSFELENLEDNLFQGGFGFIFKERNLILALTKSFNIKKIQNILDEPVTHF